jgi:hypothetical protein
VLTLARARHGDEPGLYDVWSTELREFVLESADETEVRKYVRSEALLQADAAVDAMLAGLPHETH